MGKHTPNLEQELRFKESRGWGEGPRSNFVGHFSAKRTRVGIPESIHVSLNMESLLLTCLCQGTENSWLVAAWRASLPTQCLCKRDLFKTTEPAGGRMRGWVRGSVSRLGCSFHVAFLAQLKSSRDLRGCVPARITQSPLPSPVTHCELFLCKGEKLWILIKWEGAHRGNWACYRRSSVYSGTTGRAIGSPAFTSAFPLSVLFPLFLLSPCSSPLLLPPVQSDNHPGVSFSCYGCSWFWVLEVCTWRLVKPCS